MYGPCSGSVALCQNAFKNFYELFCQSLFYCHQNYKNINFSKQKKIDRAQFGYIINECMGHVLAQLRSVKMLLKIFMNYFVSHFFTVTKITILLISQNKQKLTERNLDTLLMNVWAMFWLSCALSKCF